MSESILDDVSAETSELQQKVWQCGEQNSSHQLLLEHVNKLAQADLPSVYLQDEGSILITMSYHLVIF